MLHACESDLVAMSLLANAWIKFISRVGSCRSNLLVPNCIAMWPWSGIGGNTAVSKRSTSEIGGRSGHISLVANSFCENFCFVSSKWAWLMRGAVASTKFWHTVILPSVGALISPLGLLKAVFKQFYGRYLAVRLGPQANSSDQLEVDALWPEVKRINLVSISKQGAKLQIHRATHCWSHYLADNHRIRLEWKKGETFSFRTNFTIQCTHT